MLADDMIQAHVESRQLAHECAIMHRDYKNFVSSWEERTR